VVSAPNQSSSHSLRTLFDLHKDFRPNLETEVQMFLEFVAEIYTGFKETVTHFFGPASAGAPTEGETPAAVIDDGFLGKAKPGEVPTSKRSFRVVTECPVIVMFLFQLYPRHIAQNTPKLLPVMVQAISVPGPPPDQVPQFLKKAFEDLKAAQVKTVSFLTYLLQRFAEEIRVHQDTIAGSVVGLLKTCPDSVAIRKELLVATRNYLVTDFRKGFYKYVPMLLDEKVLVGKGRACYAMLRPQAYSLLAELIHHVRMDLTHAQLGHVIYLFSRNLHDVTLPLTLHTISFRLMLTLVDCIYQRRHETNEGRVLLGKITEAFMQRLGTLKRSVPKLLKVMKQKAEDDAAAAAAKAGTATTAMDGSTAVVAKLVDGKGAEGQADEKDQEKKSDVLYLKAGVEPIKEVHDNKNLLRTIVLGMKTLVWSISNYNRPNNPTPGQPAPVPPPAPRGPKGLTPEELHTTSRLLTSGLSCLRLFFETGDGEEILEPFGGVFTVMEHRNFLDLVNTQFPRMFVAIVETPPLCKIVAWLLNNQQLSIHMTDILMTYLMNNKLHMLTQPDHPDTVLVLRLFHLIFSALSKYNDVELVIRPHTAALVEACLKGLLQATDPQAIIRLMRYIFRSFTHSKIESLYREFLPLLPQALHLLLTMLEAPDEHNLEDALVELCLRLPVRLSALAPFLPSMMKPILCALRSKQDELVVLGLCVLDNWVDQMYTQFLHYNTKLVDSELLSALWNVLKPPSQPTASHPNPNTLFTIPFKAMSILGKLGANNQVRTLRVRSSCHRLS
jgi:transformation/transcription domain-associated protein